MVSTQETAAGGGRERRGKGGRGGGGRIPPRPRLCLCLGIKSFRLLLLDPGGSLGTSLGHRMSVLPYLVPSRPTLPRPPLGLIYPSTGIVAVRFEVVITQTPPPPRRRFGTCVRLSVLPVAQSKCLLCGGPPPKPSRAWYRPTGP